MRISGAILAAGMSSRMVRNKLLLPFRGMTVIEHVLHAAIDTSLDGIMVITGHERKRMEEIVGGISNTRVRPIFNPQFAQGRAESIKTAVQRAQNADALLFLVGDKPTIGAALVEKTLNAFKAEKPDICYVKTPSGRGHPIMFSKRVFPELLALRGDIVGDDLIARHGDGILEITDGEIQWDIDTDDDYERLLTSMPEAVSHD